VKSYFLKLVVAGVILINAMTSASAQVLYDANGWEGTGGPPNWTLGNIAPQNTWISFGSDTLSRDVVVGATTLGPLTVVPKTGSRMHRSTSSNDNQGLRARWTWKDLASAWAGRTAGNNTVLVSMDCFLPSSSADSFHLHGIDTYDPSGFFSLGGWLVQNNIQAITLFEESNLDSYIITDILPRDTWTHFDFIMDYDGGRAELFIDGVKFAGVGLDGTVFESVRLPAEEFGDADFFSQNDPEQPVASDFFTDNYRVEAIHTTRFIGQIRLEDVDFDDADSPIAVTFILQDLNGVPVNAVYFVEALSDSSGDPSLGKYTLRIHDVAPGDYKLYIKGVRHLSRVVNVTVTGSGDVSVPLVTLKGGDANGDDSSDVLDLDQLIQSFDKLEGDEGYKPNADFDYNDSVDVLDLDILIRNFDQVGEGF
jgi:hypothetical protein